MKQQKNKADKPASKKKFKFTNFIIYALLSIVIIGVLGLGIVIYTVKTIIADTPPIEQYDINMLLAENSVIYDSDGNMLEKVDNGTIRTIIPYDQISPEIIKAFVAVEDKTFFEHKGFNYIRLVGAAIEGITHGRSPAGTSTITQQYARNMYLTDTRFSRGKEGVVRKVKEAYYTTEIEKHLDKKQILAAYLNTIELGAGVKGIEAACDRYFSKSASDIDYIEAAILAGIPQANTTYSPFTIIKNEDVKPTHFVLGEHDDENTIIFNENCLKRYKIVLSVMKSLNVITDEQYKVAVDYDIKTKLHPGVFRADNISSYFADMVKDEVVNKLVKFKGVTKEEAKNLLYNGGLRIYSTVDLKMQKTLESSYNAQEFTTDFDETTRLAAVAFQKKYGLGADGVIGPKTIDKFAELGLLDKSKITLKSFYKGLVSDEVLEIKHALERTGLLYKRNDNLPSIRAYRDKEKNILNVADSGNGLKNYGLLLLHHDSLVDGEDNLVLKNDSYQKLANGDILFKKNNSLNFYNIKKSNGTTDRIDVYVKDSYKSDPSFEERISGGGSLYSEIVSIRELYIFKGKSLAIGDEFKTLDNDGNLIVSREFFEKTPEFYKIGADGSFLVSKKYYSISKNGIIQPQSAMVVIDYTTGQLKAIVGGRNVTGQRIFNRAINPRPPGSAIKPLSVYTTALDNGYTAASVVDDTPRINPSGGTWPYNWYKAYWGIQNFREAVAQSENVIPVKLVDAMGVEKPVEYLKKFGVTTVVESGAQSDMNPAALALGGMTHGISPLEMTQAYGAIANGGVRNETITFTKITDKNGVILLENIAEKTIVVETPVAAIMHHILYTGSINGLATNAQIRSGNAGIPIAGKTGTTSKNVDAWFVGYSPYYVSAMWVGNDVQMPLSTGSNNTAKYWAKIMKVVHSELPDKSFISPSEAGLISVGIDRYSGKLPSALSHRDPEGNAVSSEWFVPGTQPKEIDDSHIELRICPASGKIATPNCPHLTEDTKVYRLRLDDQYNPSTGVRIRDDAFTLPRMYFDGLDTEKPTLKADLDFKTLATMPQGWFCDIHTEKASVSDITMKMFPGVAISTLEDGSKIFGQPIVIHTINNTAITIPYGSRINNDGAILTTDGVTIQPSQIKSYQMDSTTPIIDIVKPAPVQPVAPNTNPAQPQTTPESEPNPDSSPGEAPQSGTKPPGY